jgi:hypothetical protein
VPTPIRTAGAILALTACLPTPHPLHAETFDTCAGFIDSLPATISTQGTWCLRKDLSTSIADGTAITISANNVTIDCNGYKIGGLAAGNGSLAYGISAIGRQNATVRNCTIRGFRFGVAMGAGASHLVEDNRFDNNLQAAILIYSPDSIARRNLVYDTGGLAGEKQVHAIEVNGDILDNRVANLYADEPGGTLIGIYATGEGAIVRGNTVSGFHMAAAQGGSVATAYGIFLQQARNRASDNHLSAHVPVPGYGIHALEPGSFCIGNTVANFIDAAIHPDCIRVGNLTAP